MANAKNPSDWLGLSDRVCVVTGGASGIGRALAQELALRGAAGVVVADLDLDYAAQVADRIGGVAVACDVGDPAQVESLVAAATAVRGTLSSPEDLD